MGVGKKLLSWRHRCRKWGIQGCWGAASLWCMGRDWMMGVGVLLVFESFDGEGSDSGGIRTLSVGTRSRVLNSFSRLLS